MIDDKLRESAKYNISNGSNSRRKATVAPIILTTSLFAAFFGLTTSANAGQCIKNDSGASLKVTWYNAGGHKDDKASNSNLTAGFSACQNNSNLGFAIVECNGCGWTTSFTKGLITVGEAFAAGFCAVADGCGSPIPSNFGLDAAKDAISKKKGKFIIAPAKGKTATVKGNALGLKVE